MQYPIRESWAPLSDNTAYCCCKNRNFRSEEAASSKILRRWDAYCSTDQLHVLRYGFIADTRGGESLRLTGLGRLPVFQGNTRSSRRKQISQTTRAITYGENLKNTPSGISLAVTYFIFCHPYTYSFIWPTSCGVGWWEKEFYEDIPTATFYTCVWVLTTLWKFGEFYDEYCPKNSDCFL